MSFVFDFDKALQTVAFMLRREHGERMSYLRLVKLLYIADRESLKETGRPISGDFVVAMKHGPVLSRLLDIIKGTDLESPRFSRFVRKEGYQVELVEDPGQGKLSRYEIGKLEEVSDRYATCDEWNLVEITHDFEEWKRNDPGSSSKPIPLEDILDAVGRSAEKAAILRDRNAELAEDRVFGGTQG